LVDREWLRGAEIKRDEVGHTSVERLENLVRRWVVWAVVGDEELVVLRVQERRPSSTLESSRLGQPKTKWTH
jgi:hypothetical protein